jgi:LmbE family N-acetylglucosaminyl deacetylase
VEPEQVPGRVLVVTAHPDDSEFGAAGSVARWSDAGADVTYCVVTDGDAGGFDPAVPRTEVPKIRHAEQERAAATAGAKEVIWLGYPDGRVEVTLGLRRDIARVIRRVRPDRVVSPSPERWWDLIFASHPDHLAAGEAALCAVYPDARNPFAFPELLEEGWEPHTVAEVWLMAVGSAADSFVDITDTVDRKVAALRCHVSQEVDRDGHLDERVREWAAATAAAAGWPQGRLAEAFRRVVTA